ncbi:hypothetical protein [Leptolyngbya sp. 7M]|uniref:hypothetical protein n=1 Tax=Leptolyngbya sp. 7M TaxID=2812896 RepID=UPI001B8CD3C2|nr:hypothetical protein [Leptolyngbya sp. 7M]QYO63750.1 hypothetical protein JVX88_28500 [Leptolyngbya sp. 7M]
MDRFWIAVIANLDTDGTKQVELLPFNHHSIEFHPFISKEFQKWLKNANPTIQLPLPTTSVQFPGPELGKPERRNEKAV